MYVCEWDTSIRHYININSIKSVQEVLSIETEHNLYDINKWVVSTACGYFFGGKGGGI